MQQLKIVKLPVEDIDYPMNMKSSFDDKNYKYSNYEYVAESYIIRCVRDAKRQSPTKMGRLEFLRKVCGLKISNVDVFWRTYVEVQR